MAYAKDKVTQAITTIGIEHAKIHASKHYTVNSYITSTAASLTAGYNWLIVPSASPKLHMTFEVKSGLNGHYYLYEDFDITTTSAQVGTVVAPRNNDRNSANSIACLFYHGTEWTTNAEVLLLHEVIGSDGATPVGRHGGIIERAHELILDNTKKYLLRYVAITANDRCNIKINIYEE